jgi:hypothetical protein
VNGRRRVPRYEVPRTLNGALQTLRDVVIERRDASSVIALSDAALRVGVSLALDVFDGSERRTLPVTIAESIPVIDAGALRYRLRLASAAAPDAVEGHGLLVIDMPVRVLDISAEGMLLAAAAPAEEGTTGLARIDIDGATHAGDIRVVRCTRIDGAGADRHRVGAELLRTERVAHGSPLRHALVALLAART